MRDSGGDARGQIRTRQCWRAAATRPRSGKPRPVSKRRTRTNHNPTKQERRGTLPPGQAESGSQGVVRTVAERLAAGRLASADPNLLGGLGGKQARGQSAAIVRAVAEGRRRPPPPGPPE